MMSKKIARRNWTYEGPRTQIIRPTPRKEEFGHEREKHAHQNFVESLTFSAMQSPVIKDNVRDKIKSNKRSYKEIDEKNKARVSCLEPYQDILEKIFTQETCVSEHIPRLLAVEVDQQSGQPTMPFEETEDDDELFNSIIEVSLSDSDDPGTSSMASECNRKRKTISEKSKVYKMKVDLKKLEENQMKRQEEKEAAKRKRHEQHYMWHTEFMNFLQKNK